MFLRYCGGDGGGCGSRDGGSGGESTDDGGLVRDGLWTSWLAIIDHSWVIAVLYLKLSRVERVNENGEKEESG